MRVKKRSLELQGRAVFPTARICNYREFGGYLEDVGYPKDPVRFLISKTEEPNAWFVKDSSPGIIVVGEGLFKPHKKTGIAPILCEEDLLFVIGHEMTHARFETSFGRGPDSNGEEALCDAARSFLSRPDSIPIEQLLAKSGKEEISADHVLCLSQNGSLRRVSTSS